MRLFKENLISENCYNNIRDYYYKLLQYVLPTY